jgi:hypothetical protein
MSQPAEPLVLALCRTADSVRFIAFATCTIGVFAFECALSSALFFSPKLPSENLLFRHDVRSRDSSIIACWISPRKALERAPLANPPLVHRENYSILSPAEDQAQLNRSAITEEQIAASPSRSLLRSKSAIARSHRSTYSH